MANAAKMLGADPVRLLIMGAPGTAKTGALASLANLGYQLRVLDFDGNPQSLLAYTKPEYLPNIDIVALEDHIVDQGNFMAPKSPAAFATACKLMDRWRYEDADGVLDEKTGKRWVDLGASKDWGLETIVVLDGITGQASAALNRARFIANKTPMDTTQAVWGAAANDQLNFIKRLTAAANRHHVVVLSHVKMVGPKDTQKADSDLTKEIKEKAADLVPTKLYPTAVGWALPQNITGEFPVGISMDIKFKGGKPERRMNVLPREDMDGIKVPAKNLEALQGLGPEDGLAQLFAALGHKGPPVR